MQVKPLLSSRTAGAFSPLNEHKHYRFRFSTILNQNKNEETNYTRLYCRREYWIRGLVVGHRGFEIVFRLWRTVYLMIHLSDDPVKERCYAFLATLFEVTKSLV